ncbi:MAG: type II toxin-antitoxin system VapC family toxin [Nitrospirota bacterium]|nr:type II toxin-antitoxin system VapC family toxin [Nitrospirota bacterium]MDH5774120.1 type II toxin-antitoxin system VapC family toxin [Nitrospirota bacterium]
MSFLDTSFVIDLLREEKRKTQGPAHLKLEQLGSTPVRLSLFVICELEAGLSLSASKNEREQIQALCQHCEVVYPDDRLAKIYGKVLAQLQNLGTPIGTMDLLIGTHALINDELLISRNLKDFRKIPHLQLESY